MIGIETVVTIFLFLLGAGLIFGLLFLAVSYCEREFPTWNPFFKFLRIFLVLAAVFVLIGVILDTMGHPLIVWRRM